MLYIYNIIFHKFFVNIFVIYIYTYMNGKSFYKLFISIYYQAIMLLFISARYTQLFHYS